MVPDEECLFGFDIAEDGGLLQVFFADDAFFFVHLKHPSVSLSFSGSCGFCVGGLDGISVFLRLLQFRSSTMGGDGTAFLILESE